MKIRKKLIIYLLIAIFIIITINIFFAKPSNGMLKGNIVIWSEEKYYSYFTSIAKEFEENNKKVKVQVVKINKGNYLEKISNTDSKDLPNIVYLDFIELNKIKDKLNFKEENKEIIETYSKNFNESRLQEVIINKNYNAVPFTSNPIGLFLRSDILKTYGYKVEDINTWIELVSIGKDIYNKSNGEINIFSSKDRDNINLLITAQLVDLESKGYSEAEIKDTINEVYNNNFINDNNYICRIDSIDFYKDINMNEIDGAWECKNPPSFNIGENRFYDLGGENLVALKVDDNREAIKSFIAYSATHKELLSKELLNYNFVPSSLYSLRIKYDGKSTKTSEGSSPFLILSNIVERAPKIKNYNKFNYIIYDLYN